MPIGQKVRIQVGNWVIIPLTNLLRDIQASATMIKYDTLYTGYDPRTLLYRTVSQWENIPQCERQLYQLP